MYSVVFRLIISAFLFSGTAKANPFQSLAECYNGSIRLESIYGHEIQLVINNQEVIRALKSKKIIWDQDINQKGEIVFRPLKESSFTGPKSTRKYSIRNLPRGPQGRVNFAINYSRRDASTMTLEAGEWSGMSPEPRWSEVFTFENCRYF